MMKLRLSLQHILNPLHVYCRLTPIFGRQNTMAFVRQYELLYMKIL